MARRSRLLMFLLALAIVVNACQTPADAQPEPAQTTPSSTDTARSSPAATGAAADPSRETATGTPAVEASARPDAETRELEDHPVNPDQTVSANAMGLDLLKRLRAASEPGTNLFISPVSVALALGMAANGASGETQEGIRAALHLQGWDEKAANQAFAGLGQALDGDDLGVELDIANALWLRQGLPFRTTFLDTVARYFGARVSGLDFSSSEAADVMNGWVADQTRGRITEIVTPPIDPLAILFIMNAVYFKGDWETPFDESLTSEEAFTRADGAQVQALMMSRYGSWEYARSGDYQAVRLPYSGGRLSMIAVLPADGTSLDAWLDDLDASGWQALVGALTRKDGTVSLPRFTLSFEARLNDALAAMGMERAFIPGEADFSRIHEMDQPTWIDGVLHKSFVEVNEQGTEAAAVTSIELRAQAAAPEEPFSFLADRPFLYVLQDDSTGAILFVGINHDPTEEAARVSR